MSVIYHNGQPYATNGKLTEDELNLFKYSDGQTSVDTQVQSNSYLIRTLGNPTGVEIPLGYNPVVHEDKILQIVRGDNSQLLLEKGASGQSQAAFKQGRVYLIPIVDEDDTLLCWDTNLHISNGIHTNGYLITGIDSTNLLGDLLTPSKPKIYALDLNGIVFLGHSIRIGALDGTSVPSTFQYATTNPVFRIEVGLTDFKANGYIKIINTNATYFDECLNQDSSLLVHVIRYTNYKPR